MKVKDIRRTCFHALWFSSFYPFIKYVFTASSFQAFANHWQNKDGKARNREKVLGIEILNSAIFRLSCIGEGNGNPLQCSCLENPRDGGAWWAAICGVAQSRPQLKWLSSSSSHCRGDTGSIPEPGRFHMPQGQLSPRATTAKASALEPVSRNQRKQRNERTVHRS